MRGWASRPPSTTSSASCKAPPPYHLYNAACAVAVYSEKAKEPRFVAHALELLARAVDAGISPSEAAADPDLCSLRQSPKFERVLARKHPRLDQSLNSQK